MLVIYALFAFVNQWPTTSKERETHIFLCMLYVCRYLQGQKNLTDLQELELKAVVSCLIQVLGSELRSSGRVARPFALLSFLNLHTAVWEASTIEWFWIMSTEFSEAQAEKHIAFLPSYGTAAWLNILPQHNDICQFHNSQYLWIFPSATLSMLHIILFFFMNHPTSRYHFYFPTKKIVSIWNLKCTLCG